MTKKEIIIRQIKSGRIKELRNETKNDDNRTTKDAFIISQIIRILGLFAIIFVPWRDAISLKYRFVSLTIVFIGIMLYFYFIEPIIYYGVALVFFERKIKTMNSRIY